LLPWVYAIARRVRVDNYRKRQRIASRESAAEVLPEPPSQKNEAKTDLPAFEDLVASLPESQREVLTMLPMEPFAAARPKVTAHSLHIFVVLTSET
jgi:DNA-directed RNA polymerase specialized sigma24 family protein